MKGTDLARQYQFAAFTVGQNLEGISHDDSLRSPTPGGNCVNWVLGHLVFTHNEAMDLLGRERFWSDEQAAPYRRGAPPIETDERAAPLLELRARYDESLKEIISFLEKATPDDLGKELPQEDPLLGRTIGDAFTALAFHEAYHAGQLGILRRVVGKPGALS